MDDEREDDEREDEGGESPGRARTFTEEQSAIFSNPYGTPEATRPRTPGAESVPPDDAGATSGGGGGGGDADRRDESPE